MQAYEPAEATIAELGTCYLSVAYEELAEAYEGLRRMVERGYVALR